jgi:DNA-binding transcriptional LysR family regulator
VQRASSRADQSDRRSSAHIRPGLTLEGLRAVVVTAEELNFRRAAERLYLSTSGLSRRVRAVERAVQLELFERSSHFVRVTPAGLAFLPHASAALAAIDIGVTAAREVSGTPRWPR